MKKYSIKNWTDYNKPLNQTLSINIWFSDNAIRKWYSYDHTRQNGCPKLYSDDAILCALTVRIVFNLSLRSLEGFLSSLAAMLSLQVKIPSYTQICRRAKELGKSLRKLRNKLPKDIMFDSTGLKVYGEGEWKVRQYGKSKRRVWRKLHLAIDPDSQEIILSELTTNAKGDGEVGKKMLEKAPAGIKNGYGDGAYDDFDFRRELEKKGINSIIPPPKNAIFYGAVDGFLKKRDDVVLEILGFGASEEARAIWKKVKGYHKRSLVETMMYRLKQLTGSNLKSREWNRQSVEAQIKCLIVNRMTRLGMPKGVWQEVA